MSSDIENKVLGRKSEVFPEVEKKIDCFSANTVWEVSKEGCGTSVFNGCMVYEMMDAEAKRKARSGMRSIKCGDFSFKLKK